MEVLSLTSFSLSKPGVDFSYWGAGITFVFFIFMYLFFYYQREIGSRAI